jgi:hypothetical protein
MAGKGAGDQTAIEDFMKTTLAVAAMLLISSAPAFAQTPSEATVGELVESSL